MNLSFRQTILLFSPSICIDSLRSLFPRLLSINGILFFHYFLFLLRNQTNDSTFFVQKSRGSKTLFYSKIWSGDSSFNHQVPPLHLEYDRRYAGLCHLLALNAKSDENPKSLGYIVRKKKKHPSASHRKILANTLKNYCVSFSKWIIEDVLAL